MPDTQINVMVLGQAGSGKTFYLAGLYKELSFDRVGSVVTLRPHDGRTRELNQIYQEIVNPGQEFPGGTEWGVDTWSFDCSLTAGTGAELRKHPLFTVNYADYAGEMLDAVLREDHSGSAELRRFDETVRNADVFIILIDGLKLIRLMRREPHEDRWLNDYLASRLATLSDVAADKGTWQPVHFVVTKWDLFEDITLDQVRSMLLAQPSLDDNLQWRQARGSGPMRLIPVSVTGSFARLDEVGVMVKNPAGSVRPLNIDIPFVAILPDMLRAARDQTARQPVAVPDQSVEAAVLRDHAYRWRRGRETAAKVREPVISLVERLVDRSDMPRTAGDSAKRAADRALSWLDERMARREAAIQQQLGELQKDYLERQMRVDNRKAALELAIESFEARLNQFEKAYPGSLLLADEHAR
jgi:hypothetical protein